MYKESETLELKKSLAQLKEGVISLSAMLNKSNKGNLYFGIHDDGKICGQDIGKRTLADVTNEINLFLKPLPQKIDIHEFEEEGKKIIHVYVEGDDTPYSAYGRYYIRMNDADLQMPVHLLQNYFEKKQDNYSKWENQETIYDVNDIDEDLLIDCIRTANERGRMDYIYRNAYEALTKLGLITENGKLNNAGYYLFGNNKPLTIKEANYPTDSRTEFGEIKEFKGNIIECIKESIAYIQNHITFVSRIEGIQRVEKPEIPLRAIREIVINSFAHCAYGRTGDYNQYTIFRSFVKIYNPGSILKDIDPMKFATGKVGSKLRNLLISSTLFKYGYIDAFGTGFDRTFSLCIEEDINYSYQNDEFGFTFIFNRKSELNDKMKYDSLNETDKKIIYHLKKNKYITLPELSSFIHVSEPTIYRHIEALSNAHLLTRVGSRKNGYWDVQI